MFGEEKRDCFERGSLTGRVNFVASIYGWREMETGEGHGTANGVEWLDAPTFFQSVLSNAVALTSLFFHHLGWALINAIEVILLLACSSGLTQDTLWKRYLAFPPFQSPSHIVTQSKRRWPGSFSFFFFFPPPDTTFLTLSERRQYPLVYLTVCGIEDYVRTCWAQPPCYWTHADWGHRKDDTGDVCLTIKSDVPP